MEERSKRGPDPALFLSVFRATPIGIALEDLEGRPLFANPALCSMLGFSEEEMRTKHCVEFSPPEDAQKDWELFEQLRAGSIDHYQLEKRFFRRDGSLIRGRLSISLAGNGNSQVVIAMVEDLTEERTAQEESQRRAPNPGKLGRLIQAQDEKLTEIMRELRAYVDSLTVLNIDLARFERNLLASTASSQTAIPELRKEVRQIVRDIGALYGHLHPSRLDYLGFPAAAEFFCNELSRTRKVQVDFQCEGAPIEIRKDVSRCLYRVLEEALENAFKHSRSRQFEVSLAFAPHEIRLTVRDWGIGFDPEEAMKKPGLGLISMQERVKLVAGELSIQSELNRGAIIQARIPIDLS
jgi:PAS domain S-box-containing protein